MATPDAAVERATRRVPRASPTRRRGVIGWRRCCPRCCVLVTALIVVYPLGMVVFGSFWSTAPGQPGTLTLENWRPCCRTPPRSRCSLTSLLIAVPRTVAGAGAGHGLRLVHRAHEHAVQAPARRPSRLHVLPARAAVGAGLDAARRAQCRLAQSVARRAGPGRRGPINVYSYGGLIVLGAVRSAPVLFLFVHPAFLAMDATLEEAARMAGASALAHPVADQLAAAAAGAAGLGHPLVRGGDGILRAAAAAGHAGQHLRVHDPDLRPGLRRPCRQLRRRHGAGADPARADAA